MYSTSALNDGPAPEPRANRLLAALPADDLKICSSQLMPMRLQHGQMLRNDLAYFPTTASVSLFAGTGAGDLTEVATVGSEGVVGIGLLNGSEVSHDRAEVAIPGHALAMTGAALRSEAGRSSATMGQLVRYMQVHMSQMTRRAVCVQHHSTKQRLCYCLLDTADRCRWRTTIDLTHDSLAARLGVRRETVTACAQQLKNEGIVSYQRGVITLHDIEALRASSCSCYDEMRNTVDRLLPRHDPVAHGGSAMGLPRLGAPPRVGRGPSVRLESSLAREPIHDPA
jgi:CRP-like cAMP-binding protein